MPNTTTIKQLLEAGVHFGHQTSRWNPRMKKYIFTKRNGIHIIDLEQTTGMLDKGCEFIRQVAAEGGNILFVGTKKQAQEVVREEAPGAEADAAGEPVVLDVVLEHGADLGQIEAPPREMGVGEGDLDGQVALCGADVDEG